MFSSLNCDVPLNGKIKWCISKIPSCQFLKTKLRTKFHHQKDRKQSRWGRLKISFFIIRVGHQSTMSLDEKVFQGFGKNCWPVAICHSDLRGKRQDSIDFVKISDKASSDSHGVVDGSLLQTEMAILLLTISQVKIPSQNLQTFRYILKYIIYFLNALVRIYFFPKASGDFKIIYLCDVR